MRKMGLELENEIEPLSSERAPVYLGALCIAVERKIISRSILQRELSIGYEYANTIFRWMENKGYIESGTNDEYERRTLITHEDFESIKTNLELPSDVVPLSFKKKRRKVVSSKKNNMFDEMYKKALGFVIEENVASISFLQRRLSIGYFRAGELIEKMEEDGYIGPFTGEISRVVYITKEQYEKLMEEENV